MLSILLFFLDGRFVVDVLVEVVVVVKVEVVVEVVVIVVVVVVVDVEVVVVVGSLILGHPLKSFIAASL